MRKHGHTHSTHRLTDYTKQKRGLTKKKADREPPPPSLSREQLVDVQQRMASALRSYYVKRGVHTKPTWTTFLEDADADNSGRCTFSELMGLTTNRLKANVTRDEMRSLWSHIDEDASGEVTAKEFNVAMYRLELETWPVATSQELDATISVMNGAANKWHRAGGNWYKVFQSIDVDGSGAIGFDELQKLVRTSFPGLKIPTASGKFGGQWQQGISDSALRALWKGIDADRSGESSVAEFMILAVCMRIVRGRRNNV